MARIAIATDAWYPQFNGVVTTLDKTGQELKTLGHEVLFLTPDPFKTIPCPTYPSIQLAVRPAPGVKHMLDTFDPNCVHIATEGPLGHAARAYCLKRQLAFTTSYHTRLPEYIRLRVPLPIRWTYAYLRRFHRPARKTLVATPSLQRQLTERGFDRVVLWSRGVDTALFRPRSKEFIKAPRPVAMYAGRVAVEKNLKAFLDLDLPGSKFVVGDGPALTELREKYPSAHFIGYKHGEDLASYLAAADVFVFPSRTDTFGLVLLEAMACGVPVAAYPVTGPIDIVQPGWTGILSEHLAQAVLAALELDGKACVDYVRTHHPWKRCAELFASHLHPVREGTGSV